MTEEQEKQKFVDEHTELFNVVGKMTEGAAKMALVAALMTMNFVDKDGKIKELYERITNIFLEASKRKKE